MSTEPPRRRPGPAPRLSRELIADAAIAVGFTELTLASVAERLSATHAALYRHVTDRDDLVVAAVERLVGGLPQAPESGDWREVLEAGAWALWRMYADNPGVDQVLCAIPAAREVVIGHTVSLIRRLCAIGFDPGYAVLAADIVVDFAKSSGGTAGLVHAASAAEIRAALARASADQAENELLGGASGALSRDHRPWAARKLAVVLDGIAANTPPTQEKTSVK
ncbi:TetR/AcrR family transcriptional regulator [Allokutzneria albata]|uniref:DNA-binding transcriptional regulator, AcrR family n=1 Tax=Allokutzneria albata TaxID=211114 RepID=A0A1H0B2J0_ALLAB|nr:TetR/AcrR family transcriptional regulator [Allokutzneria albata]SDN39553.1 DNA-binding transcriptional regulator, AcrR family [Allokutzneria albata]